MNSRRVEALERLRNALTEDQITDLVIVIETAEAQGDYHFDGESSSWHEDVNATLLQLSQEFKKDRDTSTR